MEKWWTFANNHPFFVVFLITLICLILSLIDIFVLHIDELWGETFLSKALVCPNLNHGMMRNIF